MNKVDFERTKKIYMYIYGFWANYWTKIHFIFALKMVNIGIWDGVEEKFKLKVGEIREKGETKTPITFLREKKSNCPKSDMSVVSSTIFHSPSVLKNNKRIFI